MTNRKSIPIIYDPAKNYSTLDLENTTVKNLYEIGKTLDIHDVKKTKKHELIRLILYKHNERPIFETVQSVLSSIIDDIVKDKEMEALPFITVDRTKWYHANSIAQYLQYKDCRNAIYKLVGVVNKLSFDKLKLQINCPSDMQYHPQTIFINEKGVLELIKRSNQPKATGKPKREKEEVYVATTALYEKENIYKIGRSFNSKKRIATLNTSRIPSDQMYECHVVQCNDSFSAEFHIHTLLNEYRISSNREFFKIDLNTIIKVVNQVCK